MRTLDYPVSVEPRFRRAWLSYSCGLNAVRPPSQKEINEMKKQKIRDGEIDIGELIVPVRYTVIKVNKDGTMVCLSC